MTDELAARLEAAEKALYEISRGGNGRDIALRYFENGATRTWRPLTMGEWPPMGPTKLGKISPDGTRPILVLAEPK